MFSEIKDKHLHAEHSHRVTVDHVLDFHEFLPVFERAGFAIQNFEIEIGLSPKMIPHFMITKHISEPEKRQLLNETRHQRVLHMILEALFKASYLSEHVRVGALKFQGLEVYVGAIPTVRLLFKACSPNPSQEVAEVKLDTMPNWPNQQRS